MNGQSLKLPTGPFLLKRHRKCLVFFCWGLIMENDKQDGKLSEKWKKKLYPASRCDLSLSFHTFVLRFLPVYFLLFLYSYFEQLS